MNENTTNTNTTNTNEKGNTMNENTNTENMNTTTADELNNRAGYWLACKTVEVEDKDGNKHTVRLVPFASVVVGYAPEELANGWAWERHLSIGEQYTQADKKSGALNVWGTMRNHFFDSAVMVKTPTFYTDGMRIDGITDAVEFVAPNAKGRYSRSDACGIIENRAEYGALFTAEDVPYWRKATEKRAELEAQAAEKRARDEERADINRLADMLIGFGMEPEKARKRAAEQYRKAKADKASRNA